LSLGNKGDRIMSTELSTQTEPESGKLAVPLLERMDPAIGETTSVLGAIMTEFLRRTLRGGVLQIGKELHTFVDEKVDAAIVDRTPGLERVAAEVAEHAARLAATEVAHEEVRALESRTRDAHASLNSQIQEATRHAQTSTQDTAKNLTSRIEEAKKQAEHTVLETAQNLAIQIKEAARRVGDSAHAEVTQKVEELHERSRQSYAQVHERLDAQDKSGQTLVRQLQEEQKNRKAETQSLRAEIQKLTNLLRSAQDRLAELEKPRGIRAWLGRLFGKGKPKSANLSPPNPNTPEFAAKKAPT
jgi:chromosome segregation ATPase